MATKISSDLMRGHTDTIVLSALAEGDKYGYEIYKSILEKAGERIDLKEATFYAAFRRLEKDGYILSYWGDETQGGRRKYYKITFRGKVLREKNINDWKYTNKMLAILFNEK